MFRSNRSALPAWPAKFVALAVILAVAPVTTAIAIPVLDMGATESILFSPSGGTDDELGHPFTTTSLAAGTIGESLDKDSSVQDLLIGLNLPAGSHAVKEQGRVKNSGKRQSFVKGANWGVNGNTGTFQATADTVSVPEPGPLALLGLGLIGLAFAGRRKTG